MRALTALCLTLTLTLAACGAGIDDSPVLLNPRTDAGTDAADAGQVVTPPVDSGMHLSDGGQALDAGQLSPLDAGAVDAGIVGWLPPTAPESAGPYLVNTVTASVTRGSRRTPVVAHVPAGLRRAPVVIFLPGAQLTTAMYAPTVTRLASHGFIVVRADPAFSLFSPDHAAMAADARAVIDWALSSSSPIAESVDATRVAAMGHSLGGKLAIMTAFADPRVKAVFGIDPVNAQSPDVVPDQVSPLTIPLGFAGETLDAATGAGGMACAPADGNYVTFYNAAARSPWSAEWTFPGISHLAFVDSCTGLLCSFCKTSTADEGIARSNLKTLAVAFFRRHFWSDTAMESTLTGAAAPVGVTTRHR